MRAARAHAAMSTTLTWSLRRHWPEYLIEAWALGTFMVAAGLTATLLGSSASPVSRALPDPMLRNVVAGIAMGLTAIAIIHSAWGKRSGAHMNPAVTLTFLRLGKVHGWDALFFMVAQVTGATLGVLVVSVLLGSAFTDPPVSYAATLPGHAGPRANNSIFRRPGYMRSIMSYIILGLALCRPGRGARMSDEQSFSGAGRGTSPRRATSRCSCCWRK